MVGRVDTTSSGEDEERKLRVAILSTKVIRSNERDIRLMTNLRMTGVEVTDGDKDVTKRQMEGDEAIIGDD